MTLTPWEASGDIDYEKLVKEFGVQHLDIHHLPQKLQEHVLFRRGIIFAHRDFGVIAKRIEEGEPFIMMTGLMPTGRMHIGHMLVAQQMVLYQKLGAKVYVCVADLEAYNARGQSLEESRKIAREEYLLNYLALGLDPKKAEIYFQSDRSKEGELAGAYYRLQNQLARHATFNEVKAVYGEISPGKLAAALLQGSDMLHPMLPAFEGPMPVVVPVGIDQDPHLRLARGLARRLKEHKFSTLSSTYHRFIPGLGGGKMSSSDPTSFIALTDTPKEATKKVNKYAFSGGKATVEEHRKKGGDPDVDVAYAYLAAWFEPDDQKLARIHDDYQAGRMLTGELKSYLNERLVAFLEAHQEKREASRKVLDKLFPV
jgi:tryptophanyl-tRNA synthetase